MNFLSYNRVNFCCNFITVAGLKPARKLLTISLSQSMLPESTVSTDLLPLRERKKRRTQRALADVALKLFSEKGYAATTLDEIVNQVEVSKRTFFRYFTSKEDVAIAAETELWNSYIAQVDAQDIKGNMLAFLREVLVASLYEMEHGWIDRFLLTRHIAAHAKGSILYDHSEAASLKAQRRLINTLGNKLHKDCWKDVRFRMLGEFVLSAWRCGASNWVAGQETGGKVVRGYGGLKILIIRLEEAFDAIPSSISLTAPD